MIRNSRSSRKVSWPTMWYHQAPLPPQITLPPFPFNPFQWVSLHLVRSRGLFRRKWGRLVLLVLVKVQLVLDLVKRSTLAIWRLAARLMDVARTTTLSLSACIPYSQSQFRTYPSVEFIVRRALVDLRDHVDGAAWTVGLGV